MANDNGAAGVRPTHVSAALTAQRAFLAEAFGPDGGFHVVGPATPTRLRGTTPDPADDYSPAERQRLGRKLDILYSGAAFPVTVTFAPGAGDHDPEAALQRKLSAPLAAEWTVDHGRVEVRGTTKIRIGDCAECGREFHQTRPASQKRRWKIACPGCATERTRRLAAERQRRRRASRST